MNAGRKLGSFFLMAVLVCGFAHGAFAFGPCSSVYPKEVSYYPELEQCGGKAAIVLSGRLRNSFSVVVRACDNGDRDPCFKNADSCGTAQSSPFKVQKSIFATVMRGGEEVPARIHCLKEKGTSSVYRMVRRITIKRVDPVRNPRKDVLKLCLPSRIRTRNAVSIVKTGAVVKAGHTGFNAACTTQKYLGCDIDEAIQRICPLGAR